VEVDCCWSIKEHIQTTFVLKFQLKFVAAYEIQNKNIFLKKERVFIRRRKENDNLFCLFQLQEEFYTIFDINVNPEIQ